MLCVVVAAGGVISNKADVMLSRSSWKVKSACVCVYCLLSCVEQIQDEFDHLNSILFIDRF